MKRYRVTIELIDEASPSAPDCVTAVDKSNSRYIIEDAFIGGQHNRMIAFEYESDRPTDLSIHVGIFKRPL